MPITKVFQVPFDVSNIQENKPNVVNWVSVTNSVAGLAGSRKHAIFIYRNEAPFDGISRIYKVVLTLNLTSNGTNGDIYRFSQLETKGSLIYQPTWSLYNNLDAAYNWRKAGGDPVETRPTYYQWPAGTGYKRIDLTKTLSCFNHFVNQGDMSFILEPFDAGVGTTTFYSDNELVVAYRPTLTVTYTPAKPRLRSRRRQFSRRSRY